MKIDSIGYESQDKAEDALDRVRTFLPAADIVDGGQAAFEIYEDTAGEHRWRLRHRNGNILMDDGQGYDSREASGTASRA